MHAPTTAEWRRPHINESGKCCGDVGSFAWSQQCTSHGQMLAYLSMLRAMMAVNLHATNLIMDAFPSVWPTSHRFFMDEWRGQRSRVCVHGLSHDVHFPVCCCETVVPVGAPAAVAFVGSPDGRSGIRHTVRIDVSLCYLRFVWICKYVDSVERACAGHAPGGSQRTTHRVPCVHNTAIGVVGICIPTGAAHRCFLTVTSTCSQRQPHMRIAELALLISEFSFSLHQLQVVEIMDMSGQYCFTAAGAPVQSRTFRTIMAVSPDRTRCRPSATL